MSNDNVPTMVDEITFLNITLLTVKKIQPIQLCGTLQLKKKGIYQKEITMCIKTIRKNYLSIVCNSKKLENYMSNNRGERRFLNLHVKNTHTQNGKKYK